MYFIDTQIYEMCMSRVPYRILSLGGEGGKQDGSRMIWPRSQVPGLGTRLATVIIIQWTLIYPALSYSALIAAHSI